MDQDRLYFVTSTFPHEPVDRLSFSEIGNIVDAMTSTPNKANPSRPFVPLSPSNLRKHAHSYLTTELVSPNVPSLIDPVSSNTTASFNYEPQEAKSKRNPSQWESFEIQHGGRTVSMAQLSHLRVAEKSPKDNTPSTGNAILSVPTNAHERQLSMGVSPDDDLSPDVLVDEPDRDLDVRELALPLFSSSVIIHDYSGHRSDDDDDDARDEDVYGIFHEDRSESEASSNESWIEFQSRIRGRIHDRLQLILDDMDDRIESCRDRFAA